MPTSSHEPRGTGLSSSLVTDFRTILSSLEQEKSGRPDAAEGEAPPSATPIAAAASIAALSSSAAWAARPAGAPSPRTLGDVRSRIAALGDVSDLLKSRAAAPTETKPAAVPQADTCQGARRRSFGSSARQPGEAEARRKRNASKDIITWQRLGALAVFMVVVGGGAVFLQSLAAREEAKVAPEVIGNAAVASVAPSAPMPEARSVAVAETDTAASAVASSGPTPAASSVLANSPSSNSLPPALRNTSTPSDMAGESLAAPVAVTAFAAPEPAGALADMTEEGGDIDEPGAVSAEIPRAAPAPTQASLPKAAPLPPARAPERLAERTPTAVAPAEPEEAAGEGADEAGLPAGYGGEPVGTAVTRRAVTMRAAPRKGAAAIGNLPGGQKVQFVTCQQWCEIIVEGKRAFVYKSFVDTTGVANAQAATAGEEASEAATPQ
ncbi:SH3 domain-containing protein [Ancylobacter sp.]|uniref:SH3 domain-containing protein n=1 Tax=Ancylobacter sp. TaxID=1872567 RepID=UPI003D11D495